MISITVNGEQLDLLANTSIEFEFINPAFSSAGQDGSFGYPFSLPGTTKNHRITGHAYNLQKREVLGISIPATVHVLGLPIADGILKLTYPVSREQVKVFVVVNTFADAVKGQKLRSINFPEQIDFADTDALRTHMDDAIPAHTYEHTFFPSILCPFNIFHQNKHFEGDFFAEDLGKLTSVAHPFLYYIYKRLIETNGYTFDDRFFVTDDLLNLVFYHHRPVGANEDGTYYVNISELVPDIEVTELIKAIDSLFCLKTYIDIRRKTLKVLPLQNLLDSGFIEWTDKADSYYEVEPEEFNGFKLIQKWGEDKLHEFYYRVHFQIVVGASNFYDWNLKDRVENIEDLADIESPDHYQTIYINGSSSFYYWDDDEWKELNYKKMGAYDDPLSLPSPVENGVYYSNNDRQFFIYIKISDPSTGSVAPVWWHFAYPKIEDYTSGLEERTFEALAQTVELRQHGFRNREFPSEWRNMPFPSDHNMESPTALNEGEPDDDETIRLLIYRGLDDTEYPGPRYPFATPDEYDTRGALVGTHSLRWDGPRGLYEKFWKRWLEFLSGTRLVKRRLRLTAADIFNLDLTQQVRIENINYLIGKINVAIGMGGIGPARCELYTVGSGTESTMATTSGSAPAGGVGVMSVESTNIVG